MPDLHWDFQWPLSHLAFGILVAFVLVYSFLLAQYRRISLSFPEVDRIVLCFYLMALISLPMFSRDLFAYLEFGRLWAIYDLNPYNTGYRALRDNYITLAWFGQTTNYGPLATLVSYLPGLASQVSLTYGIFVYKVLSLFSCLFFLIFLRRLLEKLESPASLYLVIALHPLLLLEGLINSHNDIFALPLLILCVSAFLQNQFLRLCFLAALLPMFKTPIGIITAAFAMYFVAHKMWRYFFVISGTTSTLMASFFYFLGSGKAIHDYVGGSQLFNSFSMLGLSEWFLKQVFYRHYLGIGIESFAVYGPKLGSLGSILFLAFVMWKFRKSEIFKNIYTIMLAIVFIFATQYWPWYGLWFFLFAFFVKEDRFKMFGALACTAGFVIYTPLFSKYLTAGYDRPLHVFLWPWIFAQYFLIGLGYWAYKKFYL